MFELPSMTGLDVRTSVVREMIKYMVCRQITCGYTGHVLDVDTCVAIVGGPDGDDVLGVVSPEAWDGDLAPKLHAVVDANPRYSVWIGRVEQA